MKRFPTTFKMKRSDPSELATVVATEIQNYFNIQFAKFKPNWSSGFDEFGLKFDADYSSYYQQDDNYYSYGELSYDESKYSTKDIREVVKTINSNIKHMHESSRSALKLKNILSGK